MQHACLLVQSEHSFRIVGMPMSMASGRAVEPWRDSCSREHAQLAHSTPDTHACNASFQRLGASTPRLKIARPILCPRLWVDGCIEAYPTPSRPGTGRLASCSIKPRCVCVCVRHLLQVCVLQHQAEVGLTGQLCRTRAELALVCTFFCNSIAHALYRSPTADSSRAECHDT